ncbi:hypothetical protein L3X38_000051 [Prunus dulcis]|uniref:Uncharacterized protein n=1 Tax=Prunus dulcis TaxID=3755 RepID=A0AAD4UQE6_PRUDU|nr:hypothetical protein L3X38_000051 [Prunus dulcis]
MGMTEAYSMIIKKLQNVVQNMHTWRNPRRKGWGTTNIAIICGQEIFVGVDTRGTSGDKKGFIENEEATKLCLINYCNILVAMAGDSAQSVEVLMDVNKELSLAWGWASSSARAWAGNWSWPLVTFGKKPFWAYELDRFGAGLREVWVLSLRC